MEKGQTRRFLSHINQLTATDEPLELDLKLRCRDQTTIVVRLHSHCSHENGERVFHTSFQDVTEEHEAEEQLRQAARVFESTLEAIVITDNAFRITKTNDAFTRMTGYHEKEVLGEDLSLVIGKEQQSDRLNRLRQEMRQGGHQQGEFNVARSQ